MRLMLMPFALALPLAACGANAADSAASPGDGPVRSYAARGFTGVELRSSDSVDVRTGGEFSVRAEGAPRDLDALAIRVVDGVLRVDRKTRMWSATSSRGVRVHVVMPHLSQASVGGSGQLRVDRVNGPIKAAIGGSGALDLGSVNGPSAEFAIGGSGRLTAAGNVGMLKVAIGGSGDVDAKQLRARGANISVAGSGGVNAVVAGDAQVSIVGSGDVVLTGGARCHVSRAGSGEARCS